MIKDMTVDIWSVVEKKFRRFCDNVSVQSAYLDLSEDGGFIHMYYYDLVSALFDLDEEPVLIKFDISADASKIFINKIKTMMNVKGTLKRIQCPLDYNKVFTADLFIASEDEEQEWHIIVGDERVFGEKLDKSSIKKGFASIYKGDF